MLFFSSLTLIEGIACAIALQFLLLLLFLRKQDQQKMLSEIHSEKILQTVTTQLHQLHLDLSQSYQSSQNTINDFIIN